MNADAKNHFRAVQLEQKSLLLAHESTLVGSLSIPEMHNSARSCEDVRNSVETSGSPEPVVYAAWA